MLGEGGEREGGREGNRITRNKKLLIASYQSSGKVLHQLTILLIEQ